MNVSKDMSAQYTADQIVSLVSDALDDDDFMVVMMMKLSAILRLRLVQASRTTFVLPSPCKRDSLLLCDSSDFDVAIDDWLDDTSWKFPDI